MSASDATLATLAALARPGGTDGIRVKAAKT
jgi:hypothetical protein